MRLLKKNYRKKHFQMVYIINKFKDFNTCFIQLNETEI